MIDKRHHQSPEKRRGKSEYPKHQAAQGALNCSDGKGSINLRMDCFDCPPKELFGVWLCQQQPCHDLGLGDQPVAQEIEQQVEGDKHFERLQQ